MILDANNNQEHELYVKAIRSLNTHNKVSDHTKEPETREEQAFMVETNKACSTSCFGFNVEEDRWNSIFTKNDLYQAIIAEPLSDELCTLEFINTILDDMYGESD